MSTLNPKSKRSLWKKLSMSVALTAASMTFIPSVHATNELGEWYNTILIKFRLRPQQLDNLLLVKQFSHKSGHPEIIQALMLQESGADIGVKSNGGCYGPLQIKASTAYSVVIKDDDIRSRYFGESSLTTKAVIAKLKSDLAFSIELADTMLAHNLERTRDLNRVIYAYNRGDKNMMTVKNPGSLPYVKSVSSRVKNLTQYINGQNDDVTPLDQTPVDSSIEA